MYPGIHGVDVWHKPVAEFVGIDNSLICRMFRRRDVLRLAQRPLSVGAVERAEDAPFVPPCLKFPPFGEVLVLDAGLVVFLLGCHIPVLDTESSDVLGPERNAAYGEVQSGADLRLHIFPSGSDITAPRCCGISLKSCKSVSGEQEHSLVRRLGALSFVDGLGIHKCIGIEILSRGAERGRSAKCLAVVHVGAVVDVRLARIHPPGVYSKSEQVLFHLFPEQFSGAFCVCIVE